MAGENPVRIVPVLLLLDLRGRKANSKKSKKISEKSNLRQPLLQNHIFVFSWFNVSLILKTLYNRYLQTSCFYLELTIADYIVCISIKHVMQEQISQNRYITSPWGTPILCAVRLPSWSSQETLSQRSIIETHFSVTWMRIAFNSNSQYLVSKNSLISISNTHA